MKLYKYVLTSLLLALLAAPSIAGADDDYSRLVVFGDSLSDTGNNFVILGATSAAPYDPIPTFPYDSLRYSNGKVWIERLAGELDLRSDARSALANPGSTNFAFGGARAIGGLVPDVSQQVGLYLQSTGFTADPDALYVFNFGGNDIRDALINQDPASLFTAASTVVGAIQQVASLGGRNFLVLNAPDIGIVPAIPAPFRPSATQLSALFNGYLNQQLAMLPPGLNVVEVDLFGFLNSVAAAPEAFGFRDASTPCLSFGVTDNAVCAKPNKRLFWDALHPSDKGHRKLAEFALEVLDADDDDDDEEDD